MAASQIFARKVLVQGLAPAVMARFPSTIPSTNTTLENSGNSKWTGNPAPG
jgi:hypothetical protein